MIGHNCLLQQAKSNKSVISYCLRSHHLFLHNTPIVNHIMLSRNRLLRAAASPMLSRSALTRSHHRPNIVRSFGSNNDSKYQYKSLVEMQRTSCEKFADRELFGSRNKENPSVFDWMTYSDFGREVMDIIILIILITSQSINCVYPPMCTSSMSIHTYIYVCVYAFVCIHVCTGGQVSQCAGEPQYRY